jgi:hypothetical protein
MDVSTGAPLISATHSQRSSDRKSQCDVLVDELSGLHPILDRDLARIEAIAARLRQLANEQRRDIIPDSSYAAYKVSLWRELDMHARRAEDMLNSGGWAEDSLDAEHQDLLSRGPRINDYDTALMALSGEPLPDSTRRESEKPDVSAFTVIALFVGFLALAAVTIILAVHGRLLTIVLLAIGVGFAIQPWRDRIEAFIDPPPSHLKPDARCSGYRSYRIVLTTEVDVVNAHLMAADAATTTTFDHYTAIADLLAVLGRMRRVLPPPNAEHLHELELQLIGGWVSLIHDSLDGVQIETQFKELAAIASQANATLAALDAQCGDSPTLFPA